jgi:hypothetical protein
VRARRNTAEPQVSDLIDDKKFWHRDSPIHRFPETTLTLRSFQHERQIGRAASLTTKTLRSRSLRLSCGTKR